MSAPITRRASLLGLGGAALAGGATLLSASPAQAKTPIQAHASAPSLDSVDDLRATAGSGDGQQANLLGYYADTPGRGGGLVYWDDDATDADNGGTVFAVSGHPTGRWRRPVASTVDLAWFGWRGDGVADDAGRVRAAIAALPQGGVIEIGPGTVRIGSTITISRVPITFRGAGQTGELGYATQIVVATGAGNGFLLHGMRGGGFTGLQIRGESLTGGYLVATEPAGTTSSDTNYMVSFSDVRFRDGYNGLLLQGCNTIRFRDCVWNGFNGQQVILFNGQDDIHRADPVEFVQCAVSAGTDNPGTDNVVLDGLGGSAKFIATAILFGRHGLWLRNTTGAGAPKFVYFEGGGFENGHGVSALLDAGSQAQFANVYISSDGELDDVRIGSGFGNVTIGGSVIRGCGRNGIDIAGGRVTVTGSLIGNNGRTANPAFARTISGVADNGNGNVRVTTANPHGWETDDRISVLDVGGTTEANGKWTITVIDATHFDLNGVAFTHGYSGGGTAYRHGAGINIRSSASRVIITGNGIGGLADGVNRQDYGIVTAATDVLVAHNDLTGNLVAPYQLLTAPSRQLRVIGNKGTDQVDGWLTARVDGAVADGSYDFGNLLFLDGQRITVVKATRVLAAGTCSVRLWANDQPVIGAVATTTTPQTTTLVQPGAVDSTGGPQRLQLRVTNAAGASGLVVQFAYLLVA